MKNFLFSLSLLSYFSSIHASAYFLPEDFVIYTDGKTVMNWQPSPRYEEKSLPTFNFYQEEDGGYIAIYTRDPTMGVYSVGGDIYVMGQIRVRGHYKGRIFIPTGYRAGDNITQDPELLEICEKYFPSMAGHMWVGGDTGGWFGIQ
jgi:hypothetical protein